MAASLQPTQSSVNGVDSQAQSSTSGNRPDLGSSTWQSTKSLIKERFEYLFDNQIRCDVHFIVVPDSDTPNISAHELVLRAGSDVFDTLLSDRWLSDRSAIKVPDVEPAAFKMFLRFLYTDEVVFTPETVTSIWYVAHKYHVTALEEKCIDYLLSQLCPENAFTLLIKALKYDEKKLKDACLTTICSNTVGAVQADDFCNIDYKTLCLILDRSDLTISETLLFEAVVRWSEALCKRKNLPVTSRNQRRVLGDALALIRFPLMSPTDFGTRVVESKLLLDWEVTDLLLNFIGVPKPIGFIKTPRKGLYVATIFQNEASGSCGSSQSLQFYPDSSICVMGIGLYGSPNKSAEFNVHVTLRNNNCGTVLSEVSGVYDGSKRIFRVMLKKPVKLTASVYYQFNVTIQGNSSLYGTNGKQSVAVRLFPDNKQVNLYLNRTSSGQNSGQIPEVLFCT